MSNISELQDTKVQEPTMASSQPVEITTDTTAAAVNPPGTKGEDISESEFNRKNIDALGTLIRVTDKDEPTGLELLCYTRCNADDPDLIRRCRGVVFNGEKIVMNAFPYTVEMSQTDTASISSSIGKNFSKCDFYDSYEGALIRVFYFGDRWFTSTHRKLNAFRSKWASRDSFGTYFKRAIESEFDVNPKFSSGIEEGEDPLLERFQNTLDKNKQYMFLIRHSDENRIVSASPERPTLYHVGTFVEGNLIMTEDVNIPYPKKHSFSNVNELQEYVSGVDIRTIQGVICFAPGNTQYKINHPEYIELFKARGNEPSIKFRYLQVRLNRKMTNMLYYLYPDWSERFEEIENTLFDIAKSIYSSYVQRFIKKRFVTVPTEEFVVIRECHSWHEEDRASNRISLEKVIECFNNQRPTNLNRMIRRFRNEKDEQKKSKVDTQQRARSNTISSMPSPSLNATVGSPPMQSPLLLSKNPQRNPAIVNLGQPATIEV
uniref:Uncharacterized protein n=1 Tax=viral metagenome TaxID=1070528 RepID=A0A6C0LXC2_9ZZZZ